MRKPNIDSLQYILDKQRIFISKWIDWDGLDSNHIYRQKEILSYIDHTIEELIELRRECPSRKHWKTDNDKPINLEKAREEYIDAVHFIINTGLVLGFSRAEDILKAYKEKHKVNIIRQKTGY